MSLKHPHCRVLDRRRKFSPRSKSFQNIFHGIFNIIIETIKVMYPARRPKV